MEEKREYLEYFDGAFDSTVAKKIKPENWPYVAYSKTEGVVYTIVPKEPTSAYQMVDLGLPSGIKWADRNVGATSPEDNGLYFDWGNVDGHAVDENGNTTDGYSFDKNTYATTSGGQFTGSTLDAEHDAATVNMGSDWRMPTNAEIRELIQETDQYGVKEDGTEVPRSAMTFNDTYIGMKFVSKAEGNNNSIFLPFAGRCDGSLLGREGLDGDVWSSSVVEGSVKYARGFFFYSGGSLSGGDSGRYYGYSVRGVRA